MLVPEGPTEDQFQAHFASNFLGHFPLSRLLLDSLVHCGKDESFSQHTWRYIANEACGWSKPAQLLFSYYLHYALVSSGCAVMYTAVEPFLVDTVNLSITGLAQRAFSRLFIKTPAEGAVCCSFSTCGRCIGGFYLYFSAASYDEEQNGSAVICWTRNKMK
ncbi:polyprenol dehydrogenase-like [Danio rerio]|uniref:Dehydrogenase/reductase SDR family member on chromosome X-like n=2 Tax=Danio rerio TaxID=7955 RepID=A0AB32U226_DANRE